MLNNQFRISYIISILLIASFLVLLGFVNDDNKEPIKVYNVYLKGDIIGVVKDKKSFEEYINNKEKYIKKKYNVDKVFMPNGVVIKKMTTFDKKVDTNAEVYKKIIKMKQFTIKGTVITITNKVDKKKVNKIYVLNKEIFDDALEELIKSFVDNDSYKSYMESTQKEIVDTGRVIKNIDVSEKITYKNTYISIDNDIFSKKSELAKYLLFGTNKKQNTYTVKDGDTIETVANANKLNVQEFLLANSQFNSENTLLYAGQKVNVGLISPIVNIEVEVNDVSDEERSFGVDIKYDSTKLQGTEFVQRQGEKGLYRVSREYQYINGQLSDTLILNSTELKPTINKVIVKGDKEVPHIADLSSWAWPTDRPYTITTYYGYRWGSMHAAIDIYGPGHGSAIYAANNGTVQVAQGGCTPGYSGCNGRRGNYIIINHNNQGYHTVYMHLSAILVKQGQTVARGQKIGTMGNTGEVYPVPSRYSPYSGTHLHFATTRGDPSRGGNTGNPFDPLTLYR
ncbi:MAG: peptidoglycan DD-metalloendopeptidase family protein [Bacilli bacterium]|nr:peptidoglycan DD-metalloendopeptidase family protein [Bacilli bacterium]